MGRGVWADDMSALIAHPIGLVARDFGRGTGLCRGVAVPSTSVLDDQDATVVDVGRAVVQKLKAHDVVGSRALTRHEFAVGEDAVL
jgi:hypothetical protein